MDTEIYLSNIASYACDKFELSTYSELVGKEDLQRELYDDGFKYYTATDSTHAEMVFDCIQQVTKSAGKTPEDIDLLIYTSSTVTGTDDEELDDYLYDAGYRHTYSMGLSGAACGSLGQAIDTALNQLTAKETIRNVIVVAVNKCPEDWNRNHYNNTCLLSDGATACLLSKDVLGLHVVDCQYAFDRKIRESTKAGTVEATMQSMKLLAKKGNVIKNEMYSEQKIGDADIEQVITNFSGYSWREIYSNVLEMDINTIFIDGMENVAHMFSGEQLINLKNYMDNAEPKSGSNTKNYIVMLFSSETGVGITLLKRADQNANH